MNLILNWNKMGKVQLIDVMYPSAPLTCSWCVSWQCCPSMEQRGCALFSTRCQNYGWRSCLFTSFQFINCERSWGTLSTQHCAAYWYQQLLKPCRWGSYVLEFQIWEMPQDCQPRHKKWKWLCADLFFFAVPMSPFCGVTSILCFGPMGGCTIACNGSSESTLISQAKGLVQMLHLGVVRPPLCWQIRIHDLAAQSPTTDLFFDDEWIFYICFTGIVSGGSGDHHALPGQGAERDAQTRQEGTTHGGSAHIQHTPGNI